jgi:hypothetical protein
VLVEATVSLGDTWELRETLAVDGGREAAVARAEEVCRTWCRYGTPETNGRQVFRTSETSWVVKTTHGWWRDDEDRLATLDAVCRVSVGELVHAEDVPVPPRPERKSRWRRG